MSEETTPATPAKESGFGSFLLWFFWGISLSFTTILSLVLMVLLAASLVLNVYLGWQLLGLQVTITRSDQPAGQPTPAATSVLVAAPTTTPVSTDEPATAEPVAQSQEALQAQVATLSAIATAAQQTNTTETRPAGPTPVVMVTPSSVPVAISPTPAAEAPPAQSVAEPDAVGAAPNPDDAVENDAVGAAASNTAPADSIGEAEAQSADAFSPPDTSSNSYDLIPIEGERESRPAAEHGDLNLALREPTPIDVDLGLVEIDGSGIDPEGAPNLSSVFEPNFTAAYTIHNWDWECNCKGDLLQEENLVLVGIATTPGEPIFIPKTKQDIYEGKYYATVLYASENNLTFVYARRGNVASGYTIHYQGLFTDPNLIKLFEESEGNQLPGLTLDTPVGVASDQLIVAIRDNGKFLDARSKKDWWE